MSHHPVTSMTTRRQFLKSAAAVGAITVSPHLTFAQTAGDARFVLVVLRGALDGLALAPPVGDPAYAGVRQMLTFAKPGQEGGALKLDSLFALNPAMPNVHRMFNNNDALVVHAVASPYRARSHFDGQDVLESGAAKSLSARDGWLNRALALAAPSQSSIALAHTVPLVLRGDQSVGSWSPSRLPDANEDTMRRLANLYADDPFFASQLEEAMATRAIAGKERKRGRGGNPFAETMKKAAAFLTAPNGARIAVTDVDGWDTHANQGLTNGNLANRLRRLDEGLSELQKGLGKHWNDTVVAVVTEFGRTVRPNGTRGTDHGTATAALLLGGAVKGGRVIADWPGLRNADLYDGRDLAPTRDLRSVFKSVLVDHMGLDAAGVSRTVFPGSGQIRVESDWFA
ncbi:MAG: DUF1501 domain-containing protein [Pseudomonadota bacterium]